MIKKKILFVITYFDCGGICRSLQNFLNQYDASEYDVDVFAMVHDGMFCGEFKNCIIVPKDIALDALVSRMSTLKGFKRVLSLVFKVLRRIFGESFQDYLFKRAGKRVLSHKSYDAVIAYSEGVPTRFVSLMNHHKKIAWIHCDYSNYIKESSSKNELAIYQAFSQIVCVSNYTKKVFADYYPSLANKVCFIYNILDSIMMKTQAQLVETPVLDSDYFNIVSVGRIDSVKRFSYIPQIAKEISKVVIFGKKGVRWYVIGPQGGKKDEYDALVKNIEEYAVQDIVILTGEMANPYYHIANANLLVNLSISEACPYVINEAKILGTPCICTDFGSSFEFIENGNNGIICPLDSIAQNIILLMTNPGLYQSLKRNLESFTYDNEKILSQINAILQ